MSVNYLAKFTDHSSQVTNMTISLDELGLTNPKFAGEFAERCIFTASMKIRISTDILWTSENAADRAYDWLAVLMFGEFLAGLGTAPTYQVVSSMNRIMAVDFTLRTNITEATLTSLMQYGAALLDFQTEGSATCHFDAADIMNYESELLEFQDDIINRVHMFDDIARLYAREYLASLDVADTGQNHHATQLSKWCEAHWQQRACA